VTSYSSRLKCHYQTPEQNNSLVISMERLLIEEKKFEQIDFNKAGLAEAEYENCSFIGCDFSDFNLSHFYFTDCEFSGCNLSMAKLGKTAFRDILFKDCKMLGLHFEHCKELLFSASFDHCILNLSCFYNWKLKKTVFKDCSLQEVDFTEADLTEAVFHHCDLAGAIFDNTVLEKADFRTAFHYVINPEMNKIKKAKFSTTGIAGLLRKYDIEIE
jgi:fluoroquinolone resistance protein